MKRELESEEDEFFGQVSRIGELSKPCNKLFGWVPQCLTYVVMIPIFVLGLLAAGTLGVEFKNLIFVIFDLNSRPGYETSAYLCMSIGFFTSGWVLIKGISAIGAKARKKVDEQNKQLIQAIYAEIECRERRRCEKSTQ
jgi:hypothetical protein